MIDSSSGPVSGSTETADAGDNPVNVYEMADATGGCIPYVASQLAVLVRQTTALQHALDAGDVAAAKAAWLEAHATYHRIGAAYDAFGDLGRAIDGRAAGLAGGTADSSFTGFHRIEFLLWSGAGTRPATAPAAALARMVSNLKAEANSLNITAEMVTRRTHEILENTLQFGLTGQDDYGSHSDLATAAADLAGTRTLVDLLRPVLEVHSPGLAARIDRDSAAVRSALIAAGGRPIAVAALPQAERERLDAAVGHALEDLSLVPEVLHVSVDQ